MYKCEQERERERERERDVARVASVLLYGCGCGYMDVCMNVCIDMFVDACECVCVDVCACSYFRISHTSIKLVSLMDTLIEKKKKTSDGR